VQTLTYCGRVCIAEMLWNLTAIGLPVCLMYALLQLGQVSSYIPDIWYLSRGVVTACVQEFVNGVLGGVGYSDCGVFLIVL
jgi:hypothetical protein